MMRTWVFSILGTAAIALGAGARRVELPAIQPAAAAPGSACSLASRSSTQLLPPAVAEGAKKLSGARAEAGPAPESDGVLALNHGVNREGPGRCGTATRPVSRFAAAGGPIYQTTSLTGVTPGDMVRWEWVAPDGSLYKTSQAMVGFGGRGCVWDGLTSEGAELPEGRWQVRVLVNQEPVAVDAFASGSGGGETVEADGRMFRQILHLHFTGMVRLGFAVIRAVCNGPGPIGGDVLALMQDDLTALENALGPGNAVVRYDLNRIRSVRDRLAGMPGDQAVVEVNRLFEEILQAVQAARISCRVGTSPSLPPPVWEGVTLAGYRLGITVSLAVCISCNQPLPDDLVGYIRSQLDAARAELLPYAGCLQGFSFGQFGTVRLGAPYTSQASHLDLTALYTGIDQAILSNDCSCDTEGAATSSAGSVRGAVRNASTGQPVSGVQVSVAGTTVSATTAADGSFALDGVPAGAQTLRASAQGFLATEVSINVTAGQTVTQNISLSPVLQSGEIRITLNWTKDASRRPDDLDMHLGGPSPTGTSYFHVYYNNTGSLTAAPFAQLEVDNIRVAGSPPTETIRLSRLTPGIYRFYVHDYSGETADGLAQSRATVQVFTSSGLAGSFTVPAATGPYWSVFSMDGQSGAITAVNQVVATTPATSPCR